MKSDIGLLLLRLSFGLMMAISHGLGKFQNLIAGKGGFPDPLGIGSMPSLALAAFGEFVCALAVAVGFKTRWAAFLSSGLMAAAYFMAHARDAFLPLLNRGELAVLYCFVFLFLWAHGSGAFSIDSMLEKRRR